VRAEQSRRESHPRLPAPASASKRYPYRPRQGATQLSLARVQRNTQLLFAKLRKKQPCSFWGRDRDPCDEVRWEADRRSSRQPASLVAPPSKGRKQRVRSDDGCGFAADGVPLTDESQQCGSHRLCDWTHRTTAISGVLKREVPARSLLPAFPPVRRPRSIATACRDSHLRAIGGAHSAHDLTHMDLDGALADLEPPRDLLV
jgi:hypothetical protein